MIIQATVALGIHERQALEHIMTLVKTDTLKELGSIETNDQARAAGYTVDYRSACACYGALIRTNTGAVTVDDVKGARVWLAQLHRMYTVWRDQAWEQLRAEGARAASMSRRLDAQELGNKIAFVGAVLDWLIRLEERMVALNTFAGLLVESGTLVLTADALDGVPRGE